MNREKPKKKKKKPNKRKKPSTILSQGEPIYLFVYFFHMRIVYIFTSIHAQSQWFSNFNTRFTWLLKLTP